MRSFALSTGSSGNCFYIESSNNTKILVDLGLTFFKTQELLENRGIDIKDIDAVFITHEHSDHIAGLKTFAKRVDCPIYLSKGTFEEVSGIKLEDRDKKKWNIVKHHNSFSVSDFKIFVVEKAHDAKEAISFVFYDGYKRIGVFTDLGSVSDEIKHILKTLDIIYFEANYCNNYVKRVRENFSSVYINRLTSDVGHLGLHQTCDALGESCNSNQKIVLSHISENTNSYENVYNSIKEYLINLEKFPELFISFQGEPTDWIE